MYQPSPPLPEETPKTSSAAMRVRQAKAQPIFKPVRMEGRRDQNFCNEARPFQAIITADHAQRIRHRAEAGMGVECDRPQYRMHQHEYDRDLAQAEPDQREWKERNRRQGVECRCE